MKRKASDKQRSGTRVRAGAATRAASGARATQQPKRGPTRRSAAKPKGGERASLQAARTRPKAARETGSEPGGAPLDPRIAAVIALALHDEALAAARAEELARPVSSWTTLARARGVQRR